MAKAQRLPLAARGAHLRADDPPAGASLRRAGLRVHLQRSEQPSSEMLGGGNEYAETGGHWVRHARQDRTGLTAVLRIRAALGFVC